MSAHISQNVSRAMKFVVILWTCDSNSSNSEIFIKFINVWLS